MTLASDIPPPRRRPAFPGPPVPGSRNVRLRAAVTSVGGLSGDAQGTPFNTLVRTRVAPPAGAFPLGKRLFDLALAGLLALPVALACAVIALCLLAAQGRPVLYRSERMRTPTEGFTLWKFRTMAGPGTPPSVTGGHQAGRITRAGRFLRAARLDELPQLWNVLRGEMSLVGPRPPLRGVVVRHPAVYARVLSARPGVTGLATLVWHRAEARLMQSCATRAEAERLYDRVCVPRKARLDRIYAARAWSPAFDLAILLATLTGRPPRRRGRPARRRPARR